MGRRAEARNAGGGGPALSRVLRCGLAGGLTAVFIAAIGMPVAFAGRLIVAPLLDLRTVALAAVPLVVGWVVAAPAPREGQAASRPGAGSVASGALAGLLAGLVLGLFVAFAVTVDVRRIFIHLSPVLVDLVTFGLGALTGSLVVSAAAALLGAVGAGVQLLGRRWRRPLVAALLWVAVFGMLEQLLGQLFRGLRLSVLSRLLYETGGGLAPLGALLVAAGAFSLYLVLEPRRQSVRERVEALSVRERRRWATLAVVGLVTVLAVLPLVLGTFLSEIFDLVGIFLLMGLGLNIVVGYAGLLDLGYVAFFAVGAYATAVLTSPAAPRWAPELTFWAALPFVVLAAAFAGVLIGTPVLRMRGDYLAIVTLGFGEIARILFLSDWLKPTFGGAQGITRIPSVAIGPLELNTPPEIFYPIAGFVLLAAYASWALQDSRIGRAWNAMREDEPVAETMGINIVTAKLSAFVTGATLASFGGALFASKIGAVFPSTFQILVSIIVLVIIIVGGMGSLPGVAVGALVLVGVPELLREFEEFRFLLYGALLIFMMLHKPEGLVPSKRRRQELHQDELLQDAWFVEQQEQDRRDAPARAAGRDPDAGLT